MKKNLRIYDIGWKINFPNPNTIGNRFLILEELQSKQNSH